MQWLKYILVCTILAVSWQAAGQTDSLPQKKRSRVGKLIHDFVFREPDGKRVIDSLEQQQLKLVDDRSEVLDEERLLRRYDGKRVSSITFDRHDVYEDKRSWFRYHANGIHIRTMESTVRYDLLLREGDLFDAGKAVMGNRLLRSRKYLAESRLAVNVNPQDTTQVDITVITLDSWTIGVGGKHYKGRREMAEIYDHNFLGTGVRAGVRGYLQSDNMRWGGTIFDFESPNFMGSFYTAKLSAGRNFNNSRLETSIAKEFILPSDYELGASYANIKNAEFELFQPDTIVMVNVRSSCADLWGGRSYRIGGGASIYLTAHYNHTRYPNRPDDTGASVNPLFHDRDEALFGVGLYRERFFTSSMIYGYGFQEYIAAGARMELIGGYSWQEFGDYIYGGVNLRRGEFTSRGYFFGSLSVGTYISPRDGRFTRNVVNAEGHWISNLWNARRSRVRQFLTLRYTQGWDMGAHAGAGVLVKFTDHTRPASFREYAAGRTRLLMNTETVVFTPHRPFGFRVAIFGFADAGLIGDSMNPLRNDFYSTFGLGIRFRNERMVFGSLQLRIGFAVGADGFIRNQMFSGSPERRMEQQRFIPSRPERVGYE